MNIEDVIKNVEGKMNPVSCYALYHYAMQVRGDLNIVELGTYKGRSLCCLGLGSKHGNWARLSAVDIWDGGEFSTKDGRLLQHKSNVYKEFLRNINICEIKNMVNIHKGYTDDVAKTWKGKIGLLHIDACHTYEGVSTDFRSWSPYLVKKAYVLFHDYRKNFPTVIQYVNELMAFGIIEKLALADSLFVGKYIKRSE